jgi:hypothetical protein
MDLPETYSARRSQDPRQYPHGCGLACVRSDKGEHPFLISRFSPLTAVLPLKDLVRFCEEAKLMSQFFPMFTFRTNRSRPLNRKAASALSNDIGPGIYRFVGSTRSRYRALQSPCHALIPSAEAYSPRLCNLVLVTSICWRALKIQESPSHRAAPRPDFISGRLEKTTRLQCTGSWSPARKC